MKKPFLVCFVLAILLIPSVVFAQEEMTVESLTQRLIMLEDRIALLEEIVDGMAVNELIIPNLTDTPMGVPIDLGDRTIQFNEYEITDELIASNITITSKSNEVIKYSNISFSMRDANGTNLERSYSCRPHLEGDILPGDRLRGNFCAVPTENPPYKLYYQPDTSESEYVVWVLE